MDSHSRIEHFIPLSTDKEKAIDYGNMLGVCDGREKITGQQGHILCCDAHKKETKISTSPLNKLQMDQIAYKPDGTIFTEPKDGAMDKDINETLLLNGVRKPDGSVRDTSTEIIVRENKNLSLTRLNMNEAVVPESFGGRAIGIGGMAQVISDFDNRNKM